MAEGEDNVDYKQIFSDKFTRRLPFPRLDVSRIILNPADPKYFYLFKNQVFDEEIAIKNYINFQEDGDNFRMYVDRIKNNKEADEDYDQDTDEFMADHFEEALDQMRNDKIFGVDEDGKSRVSLKVLTRGSKVSGQSFGFSKGKAVEKAVFGGLPGAGAVGAGPSNRAIAEQSESQEESAQQSSSLQESSNVEESADNADYSEDATPESDEGEYSEGGESELDDSADEESNFEESKSIRASESNLIEPPKLGENKPVSAAVNDADAAKDVIKAQTKKIELEELKRNMESANNQLNMNKNVNLPQNAGKEDAKKEDQKDEQEDDEKDEKIAHEYFSFNHFPTDNSGKVLKSKSLVFICCSFQPYGYAVEQKLYANADGNDAKGDFKFSQNIVFSSCGKFFVTWNNNFEFVVYNAKKLVPVFEYDLEHFDGDYANGSIYLSHDAKYICSQSYGGSFVYVYDGETGKQVDQNNKDYGLYISKFISKDELIGFNSINNQVFKIGAKNVNDLKNIENTKASYSTKFDNKGYA